MCLYTAHLSPSSGISTTEYNWDSGTARMKVQFGSHSSGPRWADPKPRRDTYPPWSWRSQLPAKVCISLSFRIPCQSILNTLICWGSQEIAHRKSEFQEWGWGIVNFSKVTGTAFYSFSSSMTLALPAGIPCPWTRSEGLLGPRRAQQVQRQEPVPFRQNLLKSHSYIPHNLICEKGFLGCQCPGSTALPISLYCLAENWTILTSLEMLLSSSAEMFCFFILWILSEKYPWLWWIVECNDLVEGQEQECHVKRMLPDGSFPVRERENALLNLCFPASRYHVCTPLWAWEIKTT